MNSEKPNNVFVVETGSTSIYDNPSRLGCLGIFDSYDKAFACVETEANRLSVPDSNGIHHALPRGNIHVDEKTKTYLYPLPPHMIQYWVWPGAARNYTIIEYKVQ